MDFSVNNIDKSTGDDLSAQFTMRMRLASDPDVDASYTAVTTTKTVAGITIPFFDPSLMDTGDYVVHTYLTSDGPTTGTKITFSVNNDAPV